MDTVRAPTSAPSFALRLVAWSLALFGLVRLPWVGTQILLPVTHLQAAVGAALVGRPSLPIEATLACSGADALALCLAATLAYPTRWRLRALGVAGGVALILTLNTIRIGTLGRLAASPRWFDVVHVYVWPAGTRHRHHRLRLRLDAPRRPAAPERRGDLERATPIRLARDAPVRVGVRHVPSALHAGPSALSRERARARHRRRGRARGRLLAPHARRRCNSNRQRARDLARSLSGHAGVHLDTADSGLPRGRGRVLRTWRATALWAAAGVPLFVGIGTARLLVVAVPALDTSPGFFIHAFSQLLVGAGMVGGLAIWRYGARTATLVRSVAALAVAVLFVRWLGGPYTRAILSFGPAGTGFDDPQGVLMFLPAFQFGLFLALWIAAFVPSGWLRFLCGASLLATTQIVAAGAVGWLVAHAGVVPPVLEVRAWALLGPAFVIATVVHLAAPRH